MFRSVGAVLVLVLILTTLMPIATQAETLTTLEKFNILKTLGIMNGIGDGSPGLELPMDRAQLAAILVRIYDLTPMKTDQGFVDVSRSHWAQREGIIGAVVQAGFLQGTNTNPKTFSPDRSLTYAEIAVVLYRVFQLSDRGKMAGVPAWAAAEVKAVIDAGLMKEQKNYLAVATRADLVEAAYEIYLRSQTIKVMSVKVIDPKTIRVSFNQSIVDPKKLKTTVKRGNINVSLTQTLNVAKNEMTLASGARLIAGEYSITLSYGSINLGTYFLTIENEKIAEINLISNVLQRIDEVTGVAYLEIKNQYGQIINDSYLVRNIDWIVTPSTTVDTSKIADGLIYITYGSKANSTQGTQLKDISKVVVIAINSSTGDVFSNELIVSQLAGSVKEIKLGSIRNKDGKVVDSIEAKIGAEYTLDFEAKDHLGNAVTNYDLLTNGSIQFVNSNPNVISIEWVKKEKNNAAIRLRVLSTLESTVVFTAIAVQSGHHDSKTIFIKGEPTLAKFILHTPTQEIIAGEKVEMSFTAIDSDGKVLTKYNDIKGKVSFSTTDANISEEKDAKGNYRLSVTFNKAGPNFLLAWVGTEYSHLQLNVLPQVKYYAISLRIEKSPTMLTGASQKLFLTIYDQYGREFPYIGSIKNYKVEVITNHKDFSVNKNYDGTFNISAKDGKTGTAVVTAKLIDDKNNIIDTAATTITFVSSDDVAQFTVTGLDKRIYASGKADAYSTKIDVSGRLSNGTEVYLGTKSSDFIKAISISNPDAFKVNNSNHIYATKEGTTDVIVIVGSSTNIATIKGSLSSSTATPVAINITGEDQTRKFSNVKGITLTDAGFFTVEDSYGVTSTLKPIYVAVDTIELIDVRHNKNVIAYVTNNGRLQFRYEDGTSLPSNANIEGLVQLQGITHNGLKATILLTIVRD